MHILVAPDKFKGSLSAAQASAALGAGWQDGRPAGEPLKVECLPMATVAPADVEPELTQAERIAREAGLLRRHAGHLASRRAPHDPPRRHRRGALPRDRRRTSEHGEQGHSPGNAPSPHWIGRRVQLALV
jgi:hypothetical protein